jgi:mannose-6-phosphate isomerase
MLITKSLASNDFPRLSVFASYPSRKEGRGVNYPLRFQSYLRPMVWGGRQLSEVLGKPLPEAGPYGEAWEISDHGSHQSVVAAGVHAGRTLRELVERQPEPLLGSTRTEPFPWLVKYLDACDWLSVQVHPDEEAVVRLWPGEGSKTEAWFILAARPGSRVYAGLRPGVDEKQLRAALAAGKVAECLHEWEPRAGDCVFLPAGTVHAVGGGVLIAEIQQTSDATFRLFDWNRRDAAGRTRQLHIEEALACIDWRGGPVEPVRASGYPVGAVGRNGSPSCEPGKNGTRHRCSEAEPVWQTLVSCRYFELSYVRNSEAFAVGGGRMQTLMVLHGRGTLRGGDGPQALRAGDTLLLPAAMAPARCEPEGGPLGVLLAGLPG